MSLAQVTHPFLIVKETDYPGMIAKSTTVPYSQSKTSALSNCTNKNYSDYDTTKTRTEQLAARSENIRYISGGCSLMYILDPLNKETYKTKIVETLKHWPEMLTDMQAALPVTSDKHGIIVIPGNGFTPSVLALDVIVNDLTPEDKQIIEQALDDVAEFYWNYSGYGWGPAKIAPRALWATYQGDMERRDAAISEYKQTVLAYLNEDGVMMDGPAYAARRYVGHRIGKYGFMHVAEFTGLDPTYYNNEQLKNFYEWIFLGGVSPIGHLIAFGDTFNMSNFINPAYNTMVQGAVKFGPAATQAAARIAGFNTRPPGELLTYALMSSTLPAAAPPSSKVWPKSQAAFWEKSLATTALMGALWNNTQEDGHSHNDVNAISLTGYGMTLLTNSGYDSFGKGTTGFDWSYIHDNAISSNTVTMNNQNHSAKVGEGITESLLTPQLDYAAGVADAAVSGRHIRNFFMVQPSTTPQLNGYFFTVDEMTGASGETVQTYFHPVSNSVTTTQTNKEYAWKITKDLANPSDFGTNPVTLNIFLGSTTSGMPTLNDGALLGVGKALIGKYLKSNFTLNASGKRNIVTVLYPQDTTHAKPTFATLGNQNYSGTSITYPNGVVDYILETPGTASRTYSSIQFQNPVSFVRLSQNVMSTYFAKQGLKLRYSTAGFVATQPVTLSMQDKSGKIVSNGSTVTFFYPGIKSVKIDGVLKTPISKSNGQVKVAVPAGEHSILLSLTLN